MPNEFAYLLDYFLTLLDGCDGKITWADMQAWSSLRKIDLQAWEAETLFLISAEHRKSQAQKTSQPQPPQI